MEFPKINIVEQGLWNPPHAPEKTPLRFVIYYELEILREAGSQSVINGVKKDCSDCIVTFSRPGDLRYSSRPTGTLFHRDFVRFEVESDPSGLFADLLSKIPSFLPSDARVEELWGSFLAFYKEKKNELKKLQAHMSLYSLLIYMKEQSTEENARIEPPSSHQQALFESICFMRDHIFEKLSTAEVARRIGYSPSHFNHLFKTYTRTTPHSYFQSLRLSEARKLLVKTSLGISEIAERLSFCNAGKLSRLFKREYGVTPGQFRKLYRSESGVELR